MITIRCAQPSDQQAWLSMDRHLPAGLFERKAAAREMYLLLSDGEPAGLLRYSLFWDSIPFCNLLWIREEFRGRGLGKRLMAHWETDMRDRGVGLTLVSTQADETAQHFYRRLGYGDCGGLVLTQPGYAQPMEIFFSKPLLPPDRRPAREKTENEQFCEKRG